MELPRRKLLLILTCPLPLVLYLLCLLITYHFVVPNHDNYSAHNNSKYQNQMQTIHPSEVENEKSSSLKNYSRENESDKTIHNEKYDDPPTSHDSSTILTSLRLVQIEKEDD